MYTSSYEALVGAALLPEYRMWPPLGTRMIGPLILITLNLTLPPGTASRLSQAARRW